MVQPEVDHIANYFSITEDFDKLSRAKNDNSNTVKIIHNTV